MLIFVSHSLTPGKRCHRPPQRFRSVAVKFVFGRMDGSLVRRSFLFCLSPCSSARNGRRCRCCCTSSCLMAKTKGQNDESECATSSGNLSAKGRCSMVFFVLFPPLMIRHTSCESLSRPAKRAMVRHLVDQYGVSPSPLPRLCKRRGGAVSPHAH